MADTQIASATLATPPPRAIAVELFDGGDFDAAAWPSVTSGPDLEMNLFQCREFLQVWTRTVGAAQRSQTYLVVAREPDGRAVLYLPLAIERHFNVSLLRFPDSGLTDANAPIFAVNRGLTAAEFAAVWEAALASLPPVDVIDLRKMPAQLNGLRNPMTYLECETDLGCGFAIELAMLRTQVHRRPTMVRARKKWRRQLQRLGACAPVEFLINPAGARGAAVVEALFAFKREQYLRTYGHDRFAVPGFRQFYREMAAPEQLGRIGHLSALTCGGAVAAAHLGFVGRSRFHYVFPSYDRRFRAFAPGYLLLDLLTSYCADEAWTVFDLGEGDFPYKHKWATETVGLYRYERSVTLRGALFLAARRMRRRFSGNGSYKVPSAEWAHE